MVKTEYTLKLGDIEVDVIRKNIKNMYLRTCTDGGIKVSAPLYMSEDEIRSLVESRKEWIREQKKEKTGNTKPWEIYQGKERETEKEKCRERIQELLPGIIKDCEQRVGVHACEWRLRDMKTRWGSCNVRKKRIWLNVWLGEYPRKYLEYVVTHELIHLLERGHNSIFYGYMDAYYPGWKEVRKQLNDGSGIMEENR